MVKQPVQVVNNQLVMEPWLEPGVSASVSGVLYNTFCCFCKVVLNRYLSRPMSVCLMKYPQILEFPNFSLAYFCNSTIPEYCYWLSIAFSFCLAFNMEITHRQGSFKSFVGTLK
jgi:hypothetical protein